MAVMEHFGLDHLSLPDWQDRELERRIADADANPDAAIPWAEFKAEWLEEVGNLSGHTTP